MTTGSEVFQKVFFTDIQTLLHTIDVTGDVGGIWTTKFKPVPINLEKVKDGEIGDTETVAFDQKVWTLSQTVQIFLQRYSKDIVLC